MPTGTRCHGRDEIAARDPVRSRRHDPCRIWAGVIVAAYHIGLCEPARAYRGDGGCGGDPGSLNRVIGRSRAAQIVAPSRPVGSSRLAFAALAAASRWVPPEAIGYAMADGYNALHDKKLSLFTDLHQTLDRLKGLDVWLALMRPRGSTPRSCGSLSNTVSTASRSKANTASVSSSRGPYNHAKVTPGGDCDQPSAFQLGGTLIPKTFEKRRKEKCPAKFLLR